MTANPHCLHLLFCIFGSLFDPEKEPFNIYSFKPAQDHCFEGVPTMAETATRTSNTAEGFFHKAEQHRAKSGQGSSALVHGRATLSHKRLKKTKIISLQVESKDKIKVSLSDKPMSCGDRILLLKNFLRRKGTLRQMEAHHFVVMCRSSNVSQSKTNIRPLPETILPH